MRVAAATALVVVAAWLAGCSESEETAADCAQQIRLDGVVYTGWSATTTDAQRFGDAERADCDDSGADPGGSSFGDEPDSVTVWSFEGYSPNEVLGVRLDQESYTIFIADSVEDSDRDNLVRKLGRAESSG